MTFRPPRVLLTCVAATGIGVGASFGSTAGIALTCLIPAPVMLQWSRGTAYAVAVCYYASAAWPLVPAARNFFGPSPPALDTLALWLVSSSALALPWAAVWTPHRNQVLWRVPVGLASSIVPPLGIIGWASPLTSAGLLFPGTAWIGLIATALLPAALITRPRAASLTAAVCVLLANSVWSIPLAPSEWEAVNTHFGAIAHGGATPVGEFSAAEWLQQRALRSKARVIVFPETVVPMWTEATDLFWQQTLARLRASGKTVVLGAGLPRDVISARPIDFSADLAVLHGRERPPWRVHQAEAAYHNAAVIRGAQTALFFQRLPVPLGMWKPFTQAGAPLNLFGPGVAQIAGERAAVWICYEQFLTWPVLRSLLERPTVILAIANDHWATGTPIPHCQAAAVRVWSRLFRIPHLSAVNF